MQILFYILCFVWTCNLLLPASGFGQEKNIFQIFHESYSITILPFQFKTFSKRKMNKRTTFGGSILCIKIQLNPFDGKLTQLIVFLFILFSFFRLFVTTTLLWIFFPSFFNLFTLEFYILSSTNFRIFYNNFHLRHHRYHHYAINILWFEGKRITTWANTKSQWPKFKWSHGSIRGNYFWSK